MVRNVRRRYYDGCITKEKRVAAEKVCHGAPGDMIELFASEITVEVGSRGRYEIESKKNKKKKSKEARLSRMHKMWFG